ncbi:MAG: ParA family protein [Flavipsychrobacter sp.]
MFVASLYNLKGGVGKTSSCVNLAYLAAKDGYNVLVWDLDPQGAASYYFSSKPKSKNASKKVINRDIDIDEAIRATDYHSLDIIPADMSSRKLDILLNDASGSKKQMKKLLKQVEEDYDFVFIDCPPSFSELANNVFHASDAVFMPVIPTTLSLRTYEIVSEYFENKKVGLEKLMCFFSMVDIRKNMHKDVMNDLYKNQHFFEHYIPNLSDIERMGVHNAPVETFAPSSYAAICYRALWAEIKEGVME